MKYFEKIPGRLVFLSPINPEDVEVYTYDFSPDGSHLGAVLLPSVTRRESVLSNA